MMMRIHLFNSSIFLGGFYLSSIKEFVECTHLIRTRLFALPKRSDSGSCNAAPLSFSCYQLSFPLSYTFSSPSFDLSNEHSLNKAFTYRGTFSTIESASSCSNCLRMEGERISFLALWEKLASFLPCLRYSELLYSVSSYRKAKGRTFEYIPT